MLDKPGIKAARLENESWYEIDDVQDLDTAESIFAPEEQRLVKFQKRYGGYWRYPHMTDFCYLVNPFFPSQKLMDELKANFESLLCNYPSGIDVNCLLVAKYFGLHKESVVVGNGASELIKSLMELLTGKIGMVFPTFEEYPKRKSSEDIVTFLPQKPGFTYTTDSLINFYDDKDISILALVNPDNPSGNYIEKQDVLHLAKWAQDREIRLIVDETFADFAETEESNTLLEPEILKEYPEMIVVKSISKSFGVPGLRLGIAASGDDALIGIMKKDVAIWNINSFAEFYMQIFEKYKSDYTSAMEKFLQVRTDYVQKLQDIKKLRVYPSQANFIMCEVLPPCNSLKLTQILLNKYNILIKDLSTQKAFDGAPYICIAVKTSEENNMLISAMKDLLR